MELRKEIWTKDINVSCQHRVEVIKEIEHAWKLYSMRTPKQHQHLERIQRKGSLQIGKEWVWSWEEARVWHVESQHGSTFASGGKIPCVQLNIEIMWGTLEKYLFFREVMEVVHGLRMREWGEAGGNQCKLFHLEFWPWIREREVVLKKCVFGGCACVRVCFLFLNEKI